VLDEADEMMNMGFRPDIEKILFKTPKTRQTITFSATMPRDILDLVKMHQKNPQHVQVSNEKSTATTVEQYYYEIENQHKLELLVSLIKQHNPYLATKLRKYGINAEGIHGDISQPKRNRIMGAFRTGKIQVLIATDVAARGIDVPNIDIIFNYEIPDDEKSYVHRIGRTGRAGKVGKAFSFVSDQDFYSFRNIRSYTKTTVTQQHFTVADLASQIQTTTASKVSAASKVSPTGKPAQDKRNLQSGREESRREESRGTQESRMINEPRVVNETNTNSLILKIKKALQQDLNIHINTVESLISEENPPIKVAAALVKLLSQSNSVSQSQYPERRDRRSEYDSPRRTRRY
jgi:superfamily II DNA/RNA helicase